jgi:DNA ligase (NAD+)
MSQERVKELTEQIIKASEAYYNNASILDDDEFDALIYELSNLDPKNSLLVKVGAEPVAEWKKAKHLTVLGSLNKVNTPNEMTKWIADTANNHSVIVVEKMDGLSIGLQYQQGKLVVSSLRGNGLEGENILVNVLKMKGCVKTIPNFTGTIRGEIILTKVDHEAFFTDYKNPRNASSGLCRRLDGEGCEHLTLVCYQVIGDGSQDEFSSEQEMFLFLTNNGFITPNHKFCKTAQEVNDMWQEYQDTMRTSLGYEIDGLVISINDIASQRSLGNGSNNRPRGKVAFKFSNQFVKTTVKEVRYECGHSGRITPVCWVEPVFLLGSTVQKASVYNADYIEKLGLDVGAEVLICKAGEIIPRIERVVKGTGTIAKVPSSCPSCGQPTEMDGKHLICPNLDCPDRVLGRIHNWVNELNLLEWGSSLLEKLVKTGKVTTIADLYTLTIEDLASIERMGKKSATKCHDILWANTEVDLAVFIGGLSIPLIGQSTVKAVMLAGYDTLGKIKAMSVSDLESVSGLGPSRAKSLADGLKRYSNVIEQLLTSGVTIKEKVMGNLSGMSFVFTGTMHNKRAILEQIVTDGGGENKSGVSKGVTHLVMAKPDSTSKKAVKAKELDTLLISESDFLRMAGREDLVGEEKD